MDPAGAVLLGAGLVALLLCLSEGESWGWTSGRLLLVALTAVVLLAGWGLHQLRTSSPLVNLRLMRHRTVLTANVTGLFAGIGMYMLLPLVTRYVQAPTSTGYGFGASIVVAGLVLLPFSVASVSASRLLPIISGRLGGRMVLPLGALFLVGSLTIFLFARTALWEAFAVMGVAGLGTGLIFAAIPGLIVGSVPNSETGSALGVNQVIRQVGFSIGSALGAAILTQHTLASDPLPTNSGYTVSALIGIGLCLLTAVLSFLLPGRTTGRNAVDVVDERLLMDEASAGSAGGMMLLDAESADAELMSSHRDNNVGRPYGRHGATGGAGPRRSDFALVRR
jgi:predicted MFS family arabinose efflux permease